jgi:hypothetical protein
MEQRALLLNCTEVVLDQLRVQGRDRMLMCQRRCKKWFFLTFGEPVRVLSNGTIPR